MSSPNNSLGDGVHMFDLVVSLAIASGVKPEKLAAVFYENSEKKKVYMAELLNAAVKETIKKIKRK